MIPLKLELKNFLSYGDKVQTIDFNGYQLICLSGKNGHGKSAMLDAITWAIWGQARKVSLTAKADEGLLRLGQTSMMVSIEFEFNKNIYRVRREFMKTYGKNIISLDFELYSGNRFISLTDKTVRATENKIINLLGLDYDTFINTAFLRQGNANEFSKKSPKERKEILANILGLSKFDLLKQKASEYVKKFQDEKKILTALDEQAKQELMQEDFIKSEIVKNKTVFGQCVLELDMIVKELEKIEQQKMEVLAKKQKQQILEKELSELNTKYFNEQAVLKNLISQWKNIHKQGLVLPDISSIEKKKTLIALEERDFRDRQYKILKLQETILQKKEIFHKLEKDLRSNIEQELLKKKTILEQELLNYKKIVFILEHNEKNKVDLFQKLKTVEIEQSSLETLLKNQVTLQTNFEKINTQFEKRKAFYQKLQHKHQSLKLSLTDIQNKKDALCDKNPACSLCQQVLTISRKQFLLQKLSKEDLFYNYQQKKIISLITILKKILVDQYEDIKQLSIDYDKSKNFINKKEELTSKAEELKKSLREQEKAIIDGIFQKKVIENSIKELETTLKIEQDLIEVKLKENKQLLANQAEIIDLEEEKNSIKYSVESHNKISQELQELETQLLIHQSLRKEIDEQHHRKKSIAYIIIDLKKLKNKMLELEELIKKGLLDSEVEISLNRLVDDLKIKQQAFIVDKDHLIRNVGSLENSLKRIETLKEDGNKRSQRVIFIDKEIEEYTALMNIFGKDGIQALLIEESIPEIEDEANIILSRLTNNSSQIIIESLRDLKKGGVRETLDIKVSDTFGIRPYEMFSGGESFRIDFALRIAISKLLARRAGTALQTLIIDEGFGSQDEEGLARLMDAIHIIGHDFACVIVVSHLPAFKDNFPVHFQVEKVTSGSTLSVLLRG